MEQPVREENFVADASTLIELSNAIATSGLVAIDTEFVRESTYYPDLCLIQIATPDIIACVDCLGTVDLAPLFAALLRPNCCWVVHSGRQDLEVIWNLTRALPARVIDTQIAAALVGFSPQLGLQDLIGELLAVALDKGYTRTDWSKRPLPEGALRYALDDVRYLLAAWAELQRRLVAHGRLSWFEEDCARLVNEPPVTDITTIFRRMKGAGGLTVDQQCAALRLVGWRERRGQESNRPRRWILADEALLRITRALPRDPAALRSIPDLPRNLVARWGAEILDAVNQANSDELRTMAAAVTGDGRPDKNRVAALQVIVKRRAEELGIHAEVLATRRDINELASRGVPAGETTSGWRAAELQAAVDAFKSD
jgi:ribonuclease D